MDHCTPCNTTAMSKFSLGALLRCCGAQWNKDESRQRVKGVEKMHPSHSFHFTSALVPPLLLLSLSQKYIATENRFFYNTYMHIKSQFSPFYSIFHPFLRKPICFRQGMSDIPCRLPSLDQLKQ